MIYCLRCGNIIGQTDRFCQHCGLAREDIVHSRFPWRTACIIALSLFIVLGCSYIVFDRLLPGMTGKRDNGDRKKVEDPLIGTIFDQELIDSWNYPGGQIDQFSAFDEQNNPLTIYRDSATGEVRSYTAVLPLAKEITVSLEEALAIAEEKSSRVSFYDDPSIILEKSELVDRGENTERYYFFHWRGRDRTSGAILLREILVYVHPQSGGIIMFLVNDGGEVLIDTTPKVTRDEALKLALDEKKDFFIDPEVVEQVLFVTKAYVKQTLAWGVTLREKDPGSLNVSILVVIDASSGSILDIIH